MSPQDLKPTRRIVDEDALPLYPDILDTGVTPATSVVTRHHIVGKGQHGDDVPENLVWVEGDGTRGTHGVLTSHCADGETGLDYPTAAAALIRFVRARPELIAYVEWKKWPGYLEDAYGAQGFQSPLAKADWYRSQGRDEEAALLESGTP